MHRILDVNGYKAPYIEAGVGPTLVLVHGSLLDYRYWQKEIAHFARNFRAIALSRRHHWPGLPEKPFSYTARAQTQDVIQFIDALGAGPVHLVGHSYGGYIAARIGYLRPDLLLTLTLMEPGGPIEGEIQGRSRVKDHKLGASLVSQGKAAQGVAHFLDTVCFEPRWQDGSKDYQDMTLSNAHTLVEQVREIRPTLPAENLAKLTCATHLMIGERSISPFPETLDRLEALIPNTRRTVIPNASHMMNVDNQGAFLAAMDAFLLAQTRSVERGTQAD